MSTDASQPLKESATGAEVKPPLELSKDKTFHLLKNSKRRSVIALLLEHGKLTKRDLNRLVVMRELNREYDAIPSKERQRIKINLAQNHMGPLKDAGVISERNGTFHSTKVTESFEQYVDIDHNPDVELDA